MEDKGERPYEVLGPAAKFGLSEEIEVVPMFTSPNKVAKRIFLRKHSYRL